MSEIKVFNYSVIGRDGVGKKGVISAENRAKVENLLSEKGYLVKSIREQKGTFLLKKKLNKDDFIQFLTEFIALIKAGLTVPEAVSQCSVRPSNPYLSLALAESLKRINQGSYLSDAFSAYPDIFDPIMVSSVKTGEMAGNLVSPLEKYKAYLEKRNNMRKKVVQALVYPGFILGAMVLVLSALFVFVMPRFVALYSDFDAQLPGPTRFIFFIADNIRIILPVFIISVIIIYYLVKTAGRNSGIIRFMDRVSLRLPLVGGIVGPLENANIARTLYTLLSGGMPLVDALQTALPGIRNSVYSDRLRRVIVLIHSGKSFASAAAAVALLPPTAIKLLEAGEASGGMENMLCEIAAYYEQIAESGINSVMAIIEPALIFLTGILVGGIIIIMYLPIFRLTEIVK